MAVQGVSGLADAWVDLTQGREMPARLVALVGPPSSGKTRWLETLVAAKEATAPYGSTPSSNDWIASGRSSAKVIVDWWLDAEEAQYGGVLVPFQSAESIFARDKLPRSSADPGLAAILARYGHEPSIAKIDYFPADRALPAFASQAGSVVAQQRLLRLSKSVSKYGALVRYAALLAEAAGASWQRLADLFARLARGRRMVAAPGVTGGVGFETARGDLVDVHGLGHADRMAFLFAATVLMVGLDRSVVLVDTPELHLPPNECSRMLTELLAICPTSQWIVATHDPATIEMAQTVIHLGGA